MLRQMLVFEDLFGHQKFATLNCTGETYQINISHNPGTPVFTHYTSARRRCAPYDVAMKNKKKSKG